MTKHPVERIAETVGGTIEEIGALPDGSGFATVSVPLPKGHWLYTERYEPPPMPFRIGTDDPLRQDLEKMAYAAAEYAIRSATDNGKIKDYDPDAMCQNFVVGLLGYYTSDGLSHDSDCPEFDPDPVPQSPIRATVEQALAVAMAGEQASEALHKSWHDRALKAEKALRFYAKHEHWMALTDRADFRTELVAIGDTSDANGWSMAEAALAEEPKG